MDKEKGLSSTDSQSRHYLATWVIAISGLGIIGVSIAVLIADSEDGAKTVFTATLPLLGSWVGTILAYYFSRENFEAATKSVTELAGRVPTREKLQSVLVNEKWISKEKMYYKQPPLENIILLPLLDELKLQNKGNRIPILNDRNYPIYIIHRSMVDKYLMNKARQGITAAALQLLTLQDVINDDPATKKLIESSFTTVPENATLAEAKTAMDRTPNCQDVFATKSGKQDDEVLGWITNVIIEENSRV